MCASCPVCHLTLPLPELERHVNDHFEDNEIARDMELAQTIALVSMSALSTMQYELNFSEDLPGTWPSRSEDNLEGCTGKHEEKVNSLVNLQLKSKFYHVEGSLVALLRTCLELDSRNICSIISGHVDHFQSTKSEDFGWGCGWRNIQMLSSHLITQRKDAREVLFGGVGFVPDIPSLQRWLEIGWERGFDTSGAKSFGNKIYGSTKWIGTTECATLLRSFGLRARIVDFECKRVDSLTSLANGLQKKRSMKQVHGPMDKFVKKLHSRSSQINPGECSGAERASFQSSSPYCFQGENSILVNHASSSKCLTKDASDHHALVNWVWNYFASEISCSSANVSVSKKTPLYFQHDGHSRTIVGIQSHRNMKGMPQQYSLLILDPSQRTADLESSLKRNFRWQRLLKRGVHTLKKPQYQLCYVDPGIALGKELEQLKAIDSILIES